MAVSSPLDEIAQKLTQDQNSTRIKKLAFYACNGVWENDTAKLNSLSFKTLIAELIQRYSTLEELNVHLNKRVQTLSKPAEYTLISNIITNGLKPLYDYQDPTQIISNKNLYADLAYRFEQDANQLRIKKLLFAICYSRWENDVDQLNAISFEQLVRQLYELVSTPEQLKAVLESIVATLNRKAEYILISDKILEAFNSLYADGIEQTQPLTVANFMPQSQASVITASTQEPIAASFNSNLNSSPSPPPLAEVDAFDVRMEIMKYTNPLRAKILIVSVLHHPLQLNRQTWSMLRSHHLDDLIEKLFHRYKTLGELEIKLKEMANRLVEADQYAQAVGAILRAGRLVYGRSPHPDTALDSSQPPSQSTPPASVDSASNPTFDPVSNPTSDDTCSFFSLPTNSGQPALDIVDIKDDSDEDSTQIL